MSPRAATPARSLRGRHLLSMRDLAPEELGHLLDVADSLKRDRAVGRPHRLLDGRTLVMIFQKPSMRTRVSFEIGMVELGGHAVNLAPADIGLGTRESVEDVAMVLSRYAHVVMARVFGHEIVAGLARHASVPVINGLSDHEHPCQALADLQTIRERKGALAGLRLAYIGDGNNVAHSLMYAAARCGMHLVVATPPGYEADAAVAADAARLAGETGGSIAGTNDPGAAIAGADVIYTDVWASMGQEGEAAERVGRFRDFRVDLELVDRADAEVLVLHCLPAHYAEEIAFEATRDPRSAVFDQAENRLHAQKALLALVAG